MSNIKEQIKSVFSKYGIDPSTVGIKFEEETAAEATTVEIQFAVENTLQDGTMIYSTADAWGIGVDIFTKDDQGNPVPLPEGDYMLQDGSTISVGSDGKVAEISAVESATEMSSEDLVAVIGSLSERIAALEAEKTELAAAVESAKKDADAVKAELASVKKAPAVPSVKSQEFKKNNAPVVASNGNSISDFMASIRAKQAN